jgi:hypothetical protein
VPHDSVTLEPVQGLIKVINGAPRSFPRHANLYGLTDLTDPAREGVAKSVCHRGRRPLPNRQLRCLCRTDFDSPARKHTPTKPQTVSSRASLLDPGSSLLETTVAREGGGKIRLPQRPEASPKQATPLPLPNGLRQPLTYPNPRQSAPFIRVNLREPLYPGSSL